MTNNLSVVSLNSNLPKVNFKADDRQQGYSRQSGISSDEIMLSKMMAEQKKKEKQQKWTRNAITCLSVGATALMAVFFGRALIKDILAERAAKNGGVSQAERELGVKTKEEIMKMFKDVSKEKSFEELEMTGELRKQLDEIVDKINRAKTYEEYCLEIQNAFLFYGPPGTGKTTFVNALCKKLNINPFMFDIGQLKGGYQGTLEKNMNAAMETFLENHRALKEKDPNHISIFFIDECDEVLQKAVGVNQNADNQIFTRLKRGIDTLKKEKGVYIFCNSNKAPKELEDAIANRVQSVFIPRPTAKALESNCINHFKNGKEKVADDLKVSNPKMTRFFEILAGDNHEFSYRNQENICWKNIKAPDDGRKLCLNDMIKSAIDSARELKLTTEEIKELESLAA